MSSMADPAGADRLSVRLRLESRGVHDAAQRNGFLNALAAGRLPGEAYAAAGFVAHHYTRYLGDLSGGRYLGPAIARVYGLSVVEAYRLNIGLLDELTGRWS